MGEHFEDAVVQIVAEADVIVAVWQGAMAPEQLEALARIAVTVGKRTAGRCGLLDVVLGPPPLFVDYQRSATTRFAQAIAPARSGIAHVVLASGPTGVAVREFLGGLLMQTRPSTPTRVFEKITRAADWLAANLPGTPPQKILALVEPMLARVM
jgi:hypothetical protein